MNEKYKDKIYDELKGFFPPEYDLTPEELENIPDCNTIKEDTVTIGNADALIEDIISAMDEPAQELEDSSSSEFIEEIHSISEDTTFNEISEEDYEPENVPTKKFHDLFDIVEMFAVCVACIIVIFSFCARLTVVEGDSMNDTLIDGEFLVISDFMYTPEQGDIVVLQDTSAQHTELQKPLIKRVIAVGGQSVDVSSTGIVTVTDKDGVTTVIDDSFIKDEAYEGRYYGHWDIPEGYIFVMGDNRNHSTDSRDYRLGIVDERCVIGKAALRVFPFSEFTVLENPLEK